MSNLFKDSFCYQVDIIVPNKERVFDQIRSLFNKYYLLTKINLSELLTDHFVEKFLNKEDLYLFSSNTKLDCDTCACLTPSGSLILSVSESLNQRIPINFSRKSSKFTGYEKYEIEISIKDVRKRKDFDFLKSILEQIQLSLYAYCTTRNRDFENDLREFFGSKRVHTCLNRIDCRVKYCPTELIEKILFKCVTNGQDWTNVENLLGCLTNNIDLEKYFKNFGIEEEKISILRIKGFIPNQIVKEIIQCHLKTLIDDDEDMISERVFLKVHGFRDSPLSLVNLEPSLEKKMRTNEENFVGICFKIDQNILSYDVIYKDFKKIFIVSQNK